MRTIENFKKENNLTDEMIEDLRIYYESPTNEHNDLSFVDYLYELKEADLLLEMLAD